LRDGKQCEKEKETERERERDGKERGVDRIREKDKEMKNIYFFIFAYFLIYTEYLTNQKQ
jgi:hypothetical protein